MGKAETAASSGIGFCSALAITISWSTWHSILWAIIHGACSWFYVFYYWWPGDAETAVAWWRREI